MSSDPDPGPVCWCCVVLPASRRHLLQNIKTIQQQQQQQQRKGFVLILTKGQLRNRAAERRMRRKDVGNVILRLRNMISLSHHQRRGFNQLSRVKLDNASMRGMNWTCANSLEDFFFFFFNWAVMQEMMLSKYWNSVVIWYRLTQISISKDRMDEFYHFTSFDSLNARSWFCFVLWDAVTQSKVWYWQWNTSYWKIDKRAQ